MPTLFLRLLTLPCHNKLLSLCRTSMYPRSKRLLLGLSVTKKAYFLVLTHVSNKFYLWHFMIRLKELEVWLEVIWDRVWVDVPKCWKSYVDIRHRDIMVNYIISVLLYHGCPCKALSSYLDNYFRLHICLSFHPSVRTYVRHTNFHFFPLPAIVSQNVNNESWFPCDKSEKYSVWVTLRPFRSMR